jgi:NADPH2:quinone reductase
MYERGQVTPVISATYPLAEAARALDEIASRRSVGKVVLVP